MDKTVENMKKLGVDPADIKAVGITNQRETIIAWDKLTGEPLYNAIGKQIFRIHKGRIYPAKSNYKYHFF